jgi:cytochrome c
METHLKEVMSIKVLLVSCILGLSGCQHDASKTILDSGSVAASTDSGKSKQTSVSQEHVIKEPKKLPGKAKIAESETVIVKQQIEVSEAEGIALAKKKNCFACHMVNMKVVGPSWKDIAAKYRSVTGAEEYLENKVAKGGSGVWGDTAMPAQAQTNEAERTLLVRYILNLK